MKRLVMAITMAMSLMTYGERTNSLFGVSFGDWTYPSMWKCREHKAGTAVNCGLILPPCGGCGDVNGIVVDTGMDNLLELDESSFDGKTDDAGEFLVSRLFGKPKGSFRSSAPGYMPWYWGRKIKLDGVKPEADGRIVLQYVVKKSDLGTWKAQTDITREEILSILPGKWSADSETRKLLAEELSWPSTDDAGKHCFTIDPSGSVVSRVPECYRSAYCDDNPWRRGDKFAIWKLHRQGETELAWYAKEQKGWLWAVRLSKDDHKYSVQDEYYLGEDEKGLYLSPGFHCESVGPKITLKFRKVAEPAVTE